MYESESDILREDGEDLGFGSDFQFSEKSIRLGFIRKVYCILMFQLVLTILIMCLFLFVEPVKEYSLNNPWIWYVALALTFVSLIVLACVPDVRRKFPINIIFLAFFTACEGVLLGAVASHYDTDTVLIAVGITAIVALGLTIFSFQTKWDFTMMGGCLFVLLIVLMIFGFLAIFLHSRILDLVYASLGALLFSFYLVFDTQLMMGGRHKYSLSPEEYIFASLNLYLDIINMFMFILAILGSARN